MVDEFIKRYINKLGLRRTVLNHSKQPKSLDEIVVYPFFGDLQSSIFVSQAILPQVISNKKYNVVISWPGASGVFNCADEYWALNSDFAYKTFHYYSDGMENLSSNYEVMIRSLNENFINVSDMSEIKKYYRTHLLHNYKNVKDFVLKGFVPNPIANLPYMRQGIKKAIVFIPWTHHKTIVDTVTQYSPMDSSIYIEAIKRLNYFGYTVYCVQNDWTHNISPVLNSSDIIYVRDSDIKNIISYIHHVGCYFDYFADYSILGYMAQVPTFSVVERNIFCKSNRDLEHYVMSFSNLNKVVFSFNYFAKSDTGLNLNVINSIIDKFDDFYETVVKNHTKVFHKEKLVSMGKYIESRVQKYKPCFISQIMKQKQESEKS